MENTPQKYPSSSSPFSPHPSPSCMSLQSLIMVEMLWIFLPFRVVGLCFRIIAWQRIRNYQGNSSRGVRVFRLASEFRLWNGTRRLSRRWKEEFPRRLFYSPWPWISLWRGWISVFKRHPHPTCRFAFHVWGLDKHLNALKVLFHSILWS